MTLSKIEWTDRSDWNPIRGCTRVSEGCGSDRGGGCYAEAMAARFSDPGQWGHGFARRTPKGGRWTGQVALQADRLLLPLKWRRSAKVFVSSTSDVFHEDLADEDIDRIFAVMALCPHLTFQLLTKRSRRMRDYLVALPNRDDLVAQACLLTGGFPSDADKVMRAVRMPLTNVWLGVSTEDQAAANARVPDLLQTPASVRFLSCEPLIGPVDLTMIEFPNARGGMECWDALDLHPVDGEEPQGCTATIDWVIAGGESGPHARPMHPGWARSLRDQCADAGVPFFFKQWGEYRPLTDAERKQACGAHWLGGDRYDPDGYMMRAGKAKTGRLLDGAEHSGFPA